MNLAHIYVWEDARVCSLKSFFWYAPQLPEASILCFLILSLLRVHHWGWLQCDGLMVQYPLFIDMAGSILSLTFSCFFELLLATGIAWFVTASLPCLHTSFLTGLPSLCVSSFLLRDTWLDYDLPKFSASAKTVSPNKVTFMATGG